MKTILFTLALVLILSQHYETAPYGVSSSGSPYPSKSRYNSRDDGGYDASSKKYGGLKSYYSDDDDEDKKKVVEEFKLKEEIDGKGDRFEERVTKYWSDNYRDRDDDRERNGGYRRRDEGYGERKYNRTQSRRGNYDDDRDLFGGYRRRDEVGEKRNYDGYELRD